MNVIHDTAMALGMLASFALVLGGIAKLRGGNRKQGGLMLLLAVIIFANVLIWTL